MSIWRLVAREIHYRKLSFGLSVLSVLVAVGCLVAELTLLRLHDHHTQQVVAAKEAETRLSMEAFEAETRERMRRLEDDYRKITRDLGFNILILPKDQNLGDLYAHDFASKTMPEAYADRLAKAGIVTINHLLPILQQKLDWSERDRMIVLVGTRGEIPIVQQDAKKPILDLVPPGTVVVGHELHQSLKLTKGDRIKLQGQEFKVHKLHPKRGNKDDITLWINLAEAQKLLDKEGHINAIMALECNCSADRLDKIHGEIAGILPDTQVLELVPQAQARAAARNRAAAEAQEARRQAAQAAAAALEREKQGRAELKGRLEEFAAVLVPLVVLGCMVWLGVLAFSNVRERAGEIGILRALGLRSGQVLALFLTRAVLVGFIGAVLGYAAGSLVGMLRGETAADASSLFRPVLLLGVVAAAPLLCALASWVPALMAARQDPAVILREG